MKSADSRAPETPAAPLRAHHFSALNQLAAGTAHEFNNVIAGILGSAEIIALDLPEKHPARESLHNIFEAAGHARDFIAKLRELGQRPFPELKPARLQNLIADSLPILRTVVAGKVQLHTRLDTGCPPVLADAAQLQQALIELCLQCWHGLLDRTGEITLSLEKILLKKNSGPLAAGEWVALTIRDNGPGLDAISLGKIFDPFHVRRRGGKKIGLELFLVRETVRLHHGEITAASEPGHGLAFQLFLPAAPGN